MTQQKRGPLEIFIYFFVLKKDHNVCKSEIALKCSLVDLYASYISTYITIKIICIIMMMHMNTLALLIIPSSGISEE